MQLPTRYCRHLALLCSTACFLGVVSAVRSALTNKPVHVSKDGGCKANSFLPACGKLAAIVAGGSTR